MDALRGLLDRKWVVGLIGLIIGIAIGVVYAWQINPVEWVDGTPEQLRQDLQVDYLRMAIDSYSVNHDVDLAVARYKALGEKAADTLRAVGENPGEVSPTAMQNFRAVVEIFEAGTEIEVTPAGEVSVEETSEAAAAAGTAKSGAARLILPVCGITALLGVLLAAALYLRTRMTARTGGLTPTAEDAPAFVEEAMEEVSEAEERPPLAAFRTSYSIGDDLYDDSFSIESPAGDFLGECGVGIGDIIGQGDPKKVSAFEVWLFDKNDIQTVTKVLLSNYAFNDEATSSRLAAKGDPVLAEPGAVIYLQTASLEVEARIVDMAYGEGPLPAESFFERLTIELRAYPRDGMTRPAAG